MGASTIHLPGTNKILNFIFFDFFKLRCLFNSMKATHPFRLHVLK